ncbi:MAG: FCD domain-containing protein [Chloroflexi bacterium]|nr:FCD domain-containing protein [Chloroflexota bacterium]
MKDKSRMSAEKTSIAPIRRPPSLHQSIKEAIKSFILDNDLQPGDALPSESELSKQLNVSRNLVREAVRGLEALGIVEIRRGSGLYVSNFSLEQLMLNIDYGLKFELRELSELYVVRRTLETGMVGDAIATKTKDVETDLKATLDAMRLKAEKGQRFPEEDRRFHQSLFASLNNQTLLKILDGYWLILNNADQLIEFLNKNPFWTYELHVPIVDAFVKGDVEATQNALNQHYANLENQLNEARKGDQ